MWKQITSCCDLCRSYRLTQSCLVPLLLPHWPCPLSPATGIVPTSVKKYKKLHFISLCITAYRLYNVYVCSELLRLLCLFNLIFVRLWILFVYTWSCLQDPLCVLIPSQGLATQSSAFLTHTLTATLRLSVQLAEGCLMLHLRALCILVYLLHPACFEPVSPNYRSWSIYQFSLRHTSTEMIILISYSALRQNCDAIQQETFQFQSTFQRESVQMELLYEREQTSCH